MPRVTVRDVGMIGVVLDIPGYELPPEAWTNVRNMSFVNKKATRCRGETVVFPDVLIEPRYLASSPSMTDPYWVYTDGSTVIAVSGNNHDDITRASGPYTAGPFTRWNGFWMNGVLILNNGLDVPQQWAPIDAGVLLQDLQFWDPLWRCASMRQFENFAMALDVTKGGIRYPTMVKWSHPADPGEVPPSWNEADPTQLAGELPMSATPGFIIDGLSIGRSFMVYKEDAFIRMDRIQTNDIFSPYPISKATGIMAQKCMTEFQPGRHLVLTENADVVVTDGQQIKSVIDKVNRESLGKRIGDHKERCLVVMNDRLKEVYVIYPLIDNDYCTEMAIWNWVDGTWSFKDITETLDVSEGIYDEQARSDVWDDDDETWDEDDTTWDERQFASAAHTLLGAFPLERQIRQVDRGQKFGTESYRSSVERDGLSLVGYARDGTPRNDPNIVKQITEVYPITGVQTTAVIQVSVGAQDRPNGPITWDGPYDFDPQTMDKVDPYIEGKYIAVKFESDSEVEWDIVGYGLNMNLVGEYL